MLGWINFIFSRIDDINITNLISTLVAGGTTISITIMVIRERWNKQARELKRQEFMDKIEFDRLATEARLADQRKIDEENRDSLSRKVEDLQSVLDRTQSEADDDRKHMRESLHTIKTELQNYKIENRVIRDDFLKVAGHLADANARLGHVATIQAVKDPDQANRVEKVNEVERIIAESGAQEVLKVEPAVGSQA